MDLRKQKGLEIAKTKTIREIEGGFIVPSQTSNKQYFVSSLDHECTCTDCQTRERNCKHVYAVEYYVQKIITGRNGKVKVETKRLNYPQNWAVYDKSQQEEKSSFMELLKDLLDAVEEPEYRFGRPKLSQRDLIFASALKVYSQFSLRRFMSDLKQAKENGYIDKTPCFASIGHFMQRKELTPILKRLIGLSASVLKGAETSFAIDSTGFRTTKFNEYCKDKHGIRKQHQWLKLHAVCGTKTNVITAVNVSKGIGVGAGDSPHLIPLANETKENGFRIEEFSADMAYSSKDNVALIDSLGGTAYIPFKKSARGKSRGKSSTWRKMFYYFQYNRDEFMQHYHKRSNIETSFSMIKAKFNDLLKSKTYTAQQNELLLKVLCHNIVVVLNETNELKINANFSKA